MLKHLLIENYALIEKLNLDFNPGFTVITGETGAGKSILLGALSLILGNRADNQVLYDKNSKCIVEGVFNIENYGLNDFFTENELDFDNALIVRREINIQGKSRAFINDTPVNLNVLKELAEKLVDIHSQNKTITLNNAGIQLSVVDCFAQNNKELDKYSQLYTSYISLNNKLKQLEEENVNAKSDIDYTQFLFDELTEADLNDPQEQQEIEKEIEILSHAGEIKNGLEQTEFALYESDESIISGISGLISVLKSLSEYHDNINELIKRFESTSVELKDLASEISRMLSNISDNPEKLNMLSVRLEIIYRLQQKHRVNSVEELIEIRERLKNKLQAVSFNDEEINRLKKEVVQLYREVKNSADAISEKRKRHFPAIEEEMLAILKELAMPHAVFKIECKEEEYSIHGKDKIRFLFSANKGVEPGELSKIASGGELSRLMLAIKSMISGKTLIPTVILDEIDSGVSGETAGRVGNIMKKMSSGMQLIAITHLPQIAGMAASHFKVNKITEGDKTRTVIISLDKKERVSELARLLSGEKITDAAVMAAEELLKF